MNGCAARASGAPAVPGRDRPVPSDVPRAELELIVDLEPEARCEESFDLGLYRDARIELVSWDDKLRTCSGRGITVRYYASKLRSEEVIALVAKLARTARVAGVPQ